MGYEFHYDGKRFKVWNTIVMKYMATGRELLNPKAAASWLVDHIAEKHLREQGKPLPSKERERLMRIWLVAANMAIQDFKLRLRAPKIRVPDNIIRFIYDARHFGLPDDEIVEALLKGKVE
ncbi:MAG: hypothetical protein ACE5L6_01960 [Candidatus Bathyarchaeia archaeon]